MKTIRVHQFGGPEVLKLEEVPDPKPAAGQVLVRVKAIGVNPVETYVCSGKYGPKEFPYTPGADCAGDVEAIGEGVKKFKIGDRVYVAGTISGSYAELALCWEKKVHPLPEHVSFEQGAAIGVPYGTAYRAMFIRGDAKAAETVLVHGASGGVGIASVQLARAFGMNIIGTAGTDEGLKLVREQGAQHVVNHRQEKYTDQIMALTEGRGVDLIMEMLANENLGKDLPMLAKRGRVVVIGNRGNVEINPRDTMTRDADIRGMSLMHADDRELEQIHSALVAGLENKSLRPVIGKKFKLDEAAKAHVAILESGAYGKIVLIP
jgi:NADPH2:quinone reductase